ncbi:DUF5753 domain-containing protein [Streptomyces sp. NPDC087263]|uniref:DUF5753 domain-containing protein n=1 Tax=Streptomyces sp. NPDC087263 TaxID=3365773 RepID=UPI00380B8339
MQIVDHGRRVEHDGAPLGARRSAGWCGVFWSMAATMETSKRACIVHLRHAAHASRHSQRLGPPGTAAASRAREASAGLGVVLDEAVLHRPFGDQQVMRGQLTHLLNLRDRRQVRVQVLPFAAGQHPATAGSFTVMRFDTDPDITYSENYDSGYMTANPDLAARDCSHRYGHLKAAALCVEDSAARIARLREPTQPGFA